MLASESRPVTVLDSASKSKQDKYTCICCRVRFESLVLQKEHFKSQWHLYNLKRKICELDPISLENFNEILANESTSKEKSGSSSDISEHSSDVDDDDDDDDWIDIGQEFEEDEKLLSRIIKSETCFFCDSKSLDIKTNIDHMNLMHGFFIPEEHFLIDLEGFMEYLGFKVGAGGICLWCNKQFNSVHGVRLHMMNKDHCKIYYDQERAIGEFREFYDYSDQEHKDMKPLDQLAVIKKRRHGRKRTLSHPDTSGCSSRKQLATYSRHLELKSSSLQDKSGEKFDQYRAKILLRTSSSNNRTMRSRVRLQNPMLKMTR